MQAPNRWLRQFVCRVGIQTRLRRLRSELADVFPDLQQITPSEHDGGYDSIFFLEGTNERLGVLRLNNPYKRRAPVWPGKPRNVLAPRARLDREWSAYEVLAPAGLSPRPLWRTDDAIVCSHCRSPRLRVVLEAGLLPLAEAFEVTLAAVHEMHTLGVAHLDLTAGNILLDPETRQVTFIDFEYKALAAADFDQQRRLDVQYLVESLLRRGAVLKRADEFATALSAALAASPLAGLAAPVAVTRAVHGRAA